MVASHLVDSDVVIDALRGTGEARGLLRGALERGDALHGSTITRAEVLGGARPREVERTEALLDSIEWLPVSEEIANRAAKLIRQYRKSHSGIDLGDYLIAATAEEIGMALWTRNVKHFPMFEGLRPAYER